MKSERPILDQSGDKCSGPAADSLGSGRASPQCEQKLASSVLGYPQTGQGFITSPGW
jgi:hypothetical protein